MDEGYGVFIFRRKQSREHIKRVKNYKKLSANY